MDNLRKSISIKQPLDPIFMLVMISALVTNNLYFLLSLLKWGGITCFWGWTWRMRSCSLSWSTLHHTFSWYRTPSFGSFGSHTEKYPIFWRILLTKKCLESTQQQLERRKCNVIYSVKYFFVAVSSVLLSAQRQRCTFRRRSTIIKHDTFGVTVRRGRKECNRARVVSTSLC